MNYYTIQPPEQIADYVQSFWVLEGNSTPDQPFIHRALADSCPELIFYYKGYFNRSTSACQIGETFTSGIYGQTQQYQKFATKTDFGIFGVYLFPYSIPRLFSLPASELSNQMTDLRTLCGKPGEILEEKVMQASTNIQRAKLISEFLEARLKNLKTEYSNILHLVKHIITSTQSTSATSLAENCYLSKRQFERKFKEYSGFSPKLFLRIVRFNALIKQTPQARSLIQIAYDCGYYDQSHFIHEFNEFSGYNPKEYFRYAGTDYRTSAEFRQ